MKQQKNCKAVRKRYRLLLTKKQIKMITMALSDFNDVWPVAVNKEGKNAARHYSNKVIDSISKQIKKQDEK